MSKQCEICHTQIPEDYGNLLCDKHYNALVTELAHQKLSEDAERRETWKDASMDGKPLTEENIAQKQDSTTGVAGHSEPSSSFMSPNGITDPNYSENPEADDKEQWLTNIKQFQHSGKLLWPPQRQMYTFVKNFIIRQITTHPQYPKYIWKPKVVDVGCGIGGGSNLLSWEADFVWGIDKNENSVKFAQEAFTREKNQIYYSSQVTFDQFDIMEETRETLKFDIVVAIEVIEHIGNPGKFLENIIKRFAKEKKGTYDVQSGATEFFISTPNRNNDGISKEKPKNPYHCREWTSQEAYNFLSKYFNKVQTLNTDGSLLQTNNKHTPILYQCSLPKI